MIKWTKSIKHYDIKLSLLLAKLNFHTCSWLFHTESIHSGKVLCVSARLVKRRIFIQALQVTVAAIQTHFATCTSLYCKSKHKLHKFKLGICRSF